jgi:hypothetical protein
MHCVLTNRTGTACACGDVTRLTTVNVRWSVSRTRSNTASSPAPAGPSSRLASAQAASQARHPAQSVVSTSTPRASVPAAAACDAEAGRGVATSAAAPTALTLKNVRRLSFMTRSYRARV